MILFISLAFAQSGRAQSWSANVDLLFYGDNTEFGNPFREGETLLGTAGRIYLDLTLSETATLRGGIFAKGRYGSHQFVEEGEPMIALVLKRGSSRFIFGSLETATFERSTAMIVPSSVPSAAGFRGPDADTPHGLLPPLQREQLVFERGHEMGIQWHHQSPRVDHDTWINWQRLNTSAHRERFDAGVRTRVAIGEDFAAHGQWHVVHEGGQQYEAGPVRDSQAAAAGLEWSHAIGASRFVLDGYGVLTRWVPDREDLDRAETGGGVFARGAFYRAGWRGHLIVWRGRHPLKDEGDANYLMARRDGTFQRKVRDYAELGIARHFRPAPTVEFDASARLHRVESQYEYSYRLLARVFLRYPR